MGIAAEALQMTRASMKPLFLRHKGRVQGVATDPSQTSLLTSLISWWKLDEASGTRVDSVVASGNDLTDNNTVTQAVGKVGNAAQFTRANTESLTRLDNSSLDVGGNIDFAWAVWVYMDSTPAGSMYIISKDPTAFAGPYAMDWDQASNRFRFWIQNAGTYKIASAVTFGAPSTATWYFIVGQHDAAADTVGISVNNGAVDTVATANMTPQDNASLFALGRWDSTNLWDGRMDEVAYWKRKLTAAEITYLYNSGAGRTWSAAGIV